MGIVGGQEFEIPLYGKSHFSLELKPNYRMAKHSSTTPSHFSINVLCVQNFIAHEK
jgi:hypothetical protein